MNVLPFRRVLFPVDYSQPCDAMVPYVADLVRQFNAGLTLVHAYEPNNVAYDDLLADPEAWPRTVQAFEEARLKMFASTAFPSIHVESSVRRGEPAEVIHSVRKQEGSDLIMMPTRGQGLVRRFLLGSVTAKVLHDGGSAVWTSTGGALGHEPAPHYRSILCALDETDEAEAVLRAAVSLAHRYRAELYLVHVVLTPPMTADFDFAEYRKDLMDAADSKLRELKTGLGIDAPLRILDAPLIEGIRAEAIRRQADLLVLGRGESQEAIGGIWSNLYSLIRESPCPVLSI
jgi:nucleotide-binding universal stress UspA family protein